MDDTLFHGLVAESDEVLFDSLHFTARAERISKTIARMRSEYPEVAYGDVNWQRIRPWREFVAQFFDDPAHITYLDRINHVIIEFSVGFNGNQSAAMLLMAWLAGSLGWNIVVGSYERQGLSRSARYERSSASGEQPREIKFEIHVREQVDCLPGELTGVRLETTGDPPEAIFEAKRAVGGFVDVRELTPTRFAERCLLLNLPMESNVISSELDAPRLDRQYQRALQVLDALVASEATSPITNQNS
jgi:glucose-6-phosphate dehydrogenase assembly protein OpcA